MTSRFAPENRPKDLKPVRDEGLNSLRAAAIVLVVIYHAIAVRDPGAHAAYAEFEVLIRYIPLEIFTAVSGFLYGGRPFARPGVLRALRDKARRLLLPLISATTMLLVLRAILPGVNHRPALEDIVSAYLFRFEHLWYLQALFLIFVVMAMLDGYGLLSTPARCFGFIAGWFVLSLVVPLNHFFGYAGLVQLLPYFLTGYALRRWPGLVGDWRKTVAAWILFLCAMALEQLDYHGLLPLADIVAEKWGFLNLIAGVSFCFLAVRYRRRIPGLGLLAEFTFSIYIFHTIGMAVANRVAALTPWEEGFDGLVIWKVILGIALPVAVDLLLRRSAILATLFLGHPWRSRRAENVPAVR